MVNYVTIGKFSELSGYTVKAIENKIQRKEWQEHRVWVKAEDGRILISITGYEAWVEAAQVSKPQRTTASRLTSPIKGFDAGNVSSASPPPLI